eukprot:g2856.t1
MDEADKHLDRLGGILRSLRAPPPDPSIPSSTTAERSRPVRQRQRQHQQLRDWQQQQQQQQQQDREQEESFLTYAASVSSRPRTASQSSQTEMVTLAPLLLASRSEHEAGKGAISKGTPAPKQPQQRMRDDDEDSRTASTARRLSAPSSTVEPPLRAAQPGDVEAETGRGSDGVDGIPVRPKVAPPSTLMALPRKRALHAWWRGLSCGVCFAAGAWAREGHGVYGAALAVAAVVGETMLHFMA